MTNRSRLAQDYQNSIGERLIKITGLFESVGYPYEVEIEWHAFQNRIANRYSPEVDIAIGPFNTGGHNLEHQYNVMMTQPIINSFINKLHQLHQENMEATIDGEFKDYYQFSVVEAKNTNKNARCLFAIEIENSSTKKHIMGSIVNAASLGRIGIGIGYSDEAFKAFLRINNYLSFLKKVDKTTYHTANFFAVTKNQFIQVLDEFETN